MSDTAAPGSPTSGAINAAQGPSGPASATSSPRSSRKSPTDTPESTPPPVSTPAAASLPSVSAPAAASLPSVSAPAAASLPSVSTPAAPSPSAATSSSVLEPYVLGQQLYSLPGAQNSYAPYPTTIFRQNEAPKTLSYETISVANLQSWSTTSVSGSNGLTSLQRNDPTGYWVNAIGSSTTSSPGPTGTISGDTTMNSRTSRPTGSTSAPGSPGRTAPPPGRIDSNKKAATAAAGVMGGLFAITLVALLFLIFKLRKARKDPFHPPPMMAFTEAGSEKDQSQISELSATNTNLMSQLEERNAQLSALQATLMRSNSVPPSLDDRNIASRFKQLEQELKDWVIIHFKSTEQRLDLSPELREILISQIPLFDRLLQQPKSRTMLLRAVAGHVIQKAFENGEFVGVGEGLGSLERSMGRNISETEFNKWRSQTFLIFSKASTAESKAHVVAAISQRIDSLLSPFSTTLDQQERLHFLYRIVESAAALSLDLGCQLAKFKVLSDPAETPFNSVHMEDVYQEHETQVDPHTGKSVNVLDGKLIQAVVFPSVIKWGDERGENYEEMKVILKGKVLT